MPDEQTVRWQARLDREFPRGLVAAWADRPGPAYQVPRVMVLRVSGGLPVVLLPVFSGADKVLGPWHVTSYERTGPRTGGPVSKVSFDTVEHAMTWNPRVPDRLARVMAPERQLFIQLAPDGGRAAQHTPEEP